MSLCTSSDSDDAYFLHNSLYELPGCKVFLKTLDELTLGVKEGLTCVARKSESRAEAASLCLLMCLLMCLNDVHE